jgi:hypothetical protein
VKHVEQAEVDEEAGDADGDEAHELGRRHHDLS